MSRFTDSSGASGLDGDTVCSLSFIKIRFVKNRNLWDNYARESRDIFRQFLSRPIPLNVLRENHVSTLDTFYSRLCNFFV